MEAILIGIISGGVVALSGYLKNKPKYDFEGFDIQKAGKTLIIGAIAGGIVGATGITTDAATLLLTSSGAVIIVENLLKSIYNKFFD